MIGLSKLDGGEQLELSDSSTANGLDESAGNHHPLGEVTALEGVSESVIGQDTPVIFQSNSGSGIGTSRGKGDRNRLTIVPGMNGTLSMPCGKLSGRPERCNRGPKVAFSGFRENLAELLLRFWQIGQNVGCAPASGSGNGENESEITSGATNSEHGIECLLWAVGVMTVKTGVPIIARLPIKARIA